MIRRTSNRPTQSVVAPSRLLAAVLSLVAAATVATLFAESSWVAELFTHFPLQYLLIAGICGIALAGLGDWRMATLAAVVVAVNLAILLEPHPFGQRAVASATIGQRLSLLLTNVQRVNDLRDPIIQYIQAVQPAVVAVLEIDRAWHRDLNTALKSYPHRLIRARGDNFGIGVYSKVPLITPEVLDLSDAGVPSLSFWISLEGTPVRLLVTHPVPPTGRRQAGFRKQQLTAIARMAKSSSTPMIVIGDLNLTPWSPHFRTLLDDGGLTDSRIGFGHHATWPTWMPLLAIPIDHALVSRGINVYEREIGPAVGSDHYPVLLDVGN